MVDLKDKVALIVGAGSGLSASIARVFADAGMRIALAARSVDDLAGLAAETGAKTFACDASDSGAVKRLFGDHAYKLSMSSTKSAIGHLLGAAGSVEAIFSILAIRDGVVPPTLNLDNPSVATAIDLAPHRPRKRSIKIALSNSFGFGGTNASLVFRGPPG